MDLKMPERRLPTFKDKITENGGHFSVIGARQPCTSKIYTKLHGWSYARSQQHYTFLRPKNSSFTYSNPDIPLILAETSRDDYP